MLKANQRSQILDLHNIADLRGNLVVVEGSREVPFEIKRVYFLYDVPAGSERAGHAHKTLVQFLLPVSGSFDVHVHDGFDKKTFHLNRPNKGLLLTPMVWRTIDNFSAGSVCLVIASEIFDESDYIRDFDQFIKERCQE